MKAVAVLDALTEFRIVSRPAELNRRRCKGKYDRILVALSNLANDKTIQMTQEEAELMFGGMPIKRIDMSLKTAAKNRKLDFRPCVVEQSGYIYLFPRTKTA
jgi:hypothetical protein